MSPDRYTRISFEPTAERVCLLRRTIIRTLTSWDVSDSGDTLDVVQLVASELLTNVVQHAPTDSEAVLVLELRGERIYLGIHDGDPYCPTPTDCEDFATSGRGLTIVHSLVAELGGTILIEPIANGGKTIWVEVPCTTDTNALVAGSQACASLSTAFCVQDEAASTDRLCRAAFQGSKPDTRLELRNLLPYGPGAVVQLTGGPRRTNRGALPLHRSSTRGPSICT